MGVEKRAGNHGLPARSDAKQGQFGLIERTGVNGVDLVVGIEAHPVIADGEEYERQQGHGQLPGGAGCENQTVDEGDEDEVHGGQAHKQSLKQQVEQQAPLYRQKLPAGQTTS